MPFPAVFKGESESSLLANARAFFASPQPPLHPSDPAYIAQLVQRAVVDTLKRFDFVPYDNPQQIRNFVANSLLSAAAEFKTESARLKALDMLGKMKDVGLFEERSVRLVEHMTTEELRERLSEKARRLREKTIDAQTVDSTPVRQDHIQENQE
jgi:hypothetical protein